MMNKNKCCVNLCRNTVESDKFRSFRFPKVNLRLCLEYQELLQKRRNAWLQTLKLKSRKVKTEEINNLRVCNAHFISGKPADFRLVDHPDWKPSVNTGFPRPNKLRCLKRKMKKYERKVNKEKVKNQTCCLGENTISENGLQNASCIQTVSEVKESGTQTDLNAMYVTALEEELRKRNEEVYALKQKVIELSLNEHSFKDNEKKITYYTGLPNLATFKLILSRIDSALSSLKVKKLSNFEKLLLTMMKLRLNTSFTGLGYRFLIATNEASYLFSHVVVILHSTFQHMVHWPDRDAIRKLIPESFYEKFGNKVAVIIDCFEMGTERPPSLQAKGETFSNYKNNYTIKYLIGITHHGFISFISNGWGGRVSDKELTEKSGFLDHLLPGDVVLADRGFTIHDVVNQQFAKLNTPAFTHGKTQLDPRDVESTRRIASVRIHVERIIASIKGKFKILKGPIPMNILRSKHEETNLMDYIVRVCCCFVNMCEPIIPFYSSLESESSLTKE